MCRSWWDHMKEWAALRRLSMASMWTRSLSDDDDDDVTCHLLLRVIKFLIFTWSNHQIRVHTVNRIQNSPFYSVVFILEFHQLNLLQSQRTKRPWISSENGLTFRYPKFNRKEPNWAWLFDSIWRSSSSKTAHLLARPVINSVYKIYIITSFRHCSQDIGFPQYGSTVAIKK